MEKLIIIKYAELSTKKDNINFFIKTLKDNINKSLKGVNALVHYDKGRMFIETKEFDKVIDILKNTFGIHEIIIGYKITTNVLEDITESILSVIKKFKTFKVECKRSDKTYPLTSMEVNKKIGGIILSKINNIKVDVHQPEILINIEIRKGETLFYFNSLKGLGGYPVSCLGKGLLMLSGGIDSPVAGYLAMKRGVKIEGVYFESPPHTSELAKDKVKTLASILSKYNTEMKLHVINLTEIQEAIYKNIPSEYLITILRRMMYRISAKIAYRHRCHILINGESIGQVASQTLTSMSVINEVIKIPVIRPLACFDKLEIIDIAKKINTYETSILPYEDCCTIFVPKHPVINPTHDLCEKYETLIDYEDMIYRAINKHEIIKINEKNSEYESLL